MVVLFISTTANKKGAGVEENIPATSKTKTKWESIAIIFIVLAILLAGTTVFFAIQSRKAENVAGSAEQESPAKKSTDETEKEYANNDAEYLIVKEWGIRFKKPTGFTGLSYVVTGENSLDFIGSIADLEGGTFQMSDDWASGVFRISQYDDYREDCYTYCPPLAFSLNGYNYYFSHPQNIMSHETASYETVYVYLLNFMTKGAEAI